jgi:hypothetical protein
MVEFMGRRKRRELLRKCSRELWLQISVWMGRNHQSLGKEETEKIRGSNAWKL